MDPFSSAAIQVRVGRAGVKAIPATAFFYTVGSRLFLVTNWHVLSGHNADDGSCLDSITAMEPNELYVRRPIVPFKVDLEDANGVALWYEHPRLGRRIDIAALEVDPDFLGCGGSDRWATPINEHRSLESIPLVLGMDLFVLGFPFEKMPTPTNAPVWKRASIATDPLDTSESDEIETLLYASWSQDVAADGHVEFMFEDDEWHAAPTTAFAAGVNEQALLGIPGDTAVQWRVVFEDGISDTYAAETGTLPSTLPTPVVRVGDESAWFPQGNFLIGSINEDGGGWTGGDYWKFIIDRKGRVVWYHLTPDRLWTTYVRKSLAGDSILYEENHYWSTGGDGADSKVHRMTLDLTPLETLATPGLHHAFTELADGSVAWGAVDADTETLERVDGAGVQTQIWDCQDYHAQWGISNNCQSNALYWNEADDTFLISFYTTSSVVMVDHASGTTLANWGGANVNSEWVFDPTDSLFSWQHGVSLTDDGNLLLSTEKCAAGCGNQETVAREYAVDWKSKTLTNVWTFGEGEGIYASTAGEAHRLDNGNTLHNYGVIPRAREVTPDGTVVWDVDWDSSQLLGRTTFIDDLYDFL